MKQSLSTFKDRLLYPEEIKESIARGVTNGQLAYAGKRGDGNYDPFVFEQVLSLDVEISEGTFILSRETVEAYRSKIISIAVGGDDGKVNRQITGVDTPTQIPRSVTSSVTVTADDQTDFISKLSWTGEVPAQKWMNFYTKVLSKHASDRHLKLQVSFEAAPSAGISPEKGRRDKGCPLRVRTRCEWYQERIVKI